MQFLGGGRGSAVLPKWGEYRQFADLRGSRRKKGGGVFEGGLILQCTQYVVSMVDTSQSGKLVTLCDMFFAQYNAGHEFRRIYIQTAHVFEGSFKP